MKQLDVCPSTELPEGAVNHVSAPDGQILVCRVDGALHAIDAICPHRGALLTQGKLNGSVIVCPWHEWAFDVTTGEGLSNPMSQLCQYKVCEEAGRVVVFVPEGPLSDEKNALQ